MTEAEALALSTGWVAGRDLYGFLPFAAAQALVATGRYWYWSHGAWGYVVQRVPGRLDEAQPA